MVVARHVEQFTRQEQVAPLIEYLGDPLETTELVLVAGGTAHKALVEAVRSAGGTIVDTDPGAPRRSGPTRSSPPPRSSSNRERAT